MACNFWGKTLEVVLLLMISNLYKIAGELTARGARAARALGAVEDYDCLRAAVRSLQNHA